MQPCIAGQRTQQLVDCIKQQSSSSLRQKLPPDAQAALVACQGHTTCRQPEGAQAGTATASCLTGGCGCNMLDLLLQEHALKAVHDCHTSSQAEDAHS